MITSSTGERGATNPTDRQYNSNQGNLSYPTARAVSVKIGIVAKPHSTEFAATLNEVVQWLRSRDCETIVEESIVQASPLDDVLTAPR